MEDWKNRLDNFIEFNNEKILIDAGKISHEKAKLYGETQFEKYRVKQDLDYKLDFDKLLLDIDVTE